ncbi:MAG: PQQ-binding-like beta-propeller repeat protein [Steroidobacteraceae bacterium]
MYSMRLTVTLLSLCMLSPSAWSADAAPSAEAGAASGAALYEQHCAACHSGLAAKAPSKTLLQFLPPDAVLHAMNAGIMQAQASALSEEQRREIAEYLTGVSFADYRPPAPPPSCGAEEARFDAAAVPGIDGWGFQEDNSRFIPAEMAGLTAAEVPRLKLKWALGYPGAIRARSQPTLGFGALYTGSQDGTVYALDAATGCVRWTFRASAEVRTPVLLASPGEAPLAFFGDLIGRVYAVEALTGKLVWQVRADDNANATMTGGSVYHAGVLYVPVSSLEEAMVDGDYPCCQFRGSVVALDAATGEQKWKTFTVSEEPAPTRKTSNGTQLFGPSGGAVWSPLTLDTKRGVVFATTGNNYSQPTTAYTNSVIGLDLGTGAIKWHWQAFEGDAWNIGCMLGVETCPEDAGPDFDLGAGLVRFDTRDERQLVLIGSKDGSAMAVDLASPEAGTLWRTQLGRGSIQGGIQWGMTADSERLYAPVADLKDAGDGKVYDGPPQPGLYALDPVSGKVLWESIPPDRCNNEPFCNPGILAAPTTIPGVIFAGHLDGMIRAYDSATGKVVWEFDSRVDIKTLSGLVARGGSMGGPGPVVYDGMLYVNSGYGIFGHLPGNVLLAFSVDGR